MQQHNTRITLVPDGEPIFDERGYQVTIEDEAGGEFVVVSSNMPGYGSIAIDVSEWDSLRSAIDVMIGRCQG